MSRSCHASIFFFTSRAATAIYTLSLHDALPIFLQGQGARRGAGEARGVSPPRLRGGDTPRASPARSEEHTSELQSHSDLVCRLLLEKKKKTLRFLRTPKNT